MSPDDFTLQPPEVAQPALFDGELAEFAWPMPAGGPINMAEPKPSLMDRIFNALAAAPEGLG